jgi:hypothetical protein
MKTKFIVYALPALILAAIHLAAAQQPKKIPRIGYFTGIGSAPIFRLTNHASSISPPRTACPQCTLIDVALRLVD